MILVSKAEHDAIKARLRNVKFAATKRKYYMEELPDAVTALKAIRQKTPTCADEKGRI